MQRATHSASPFSENTDELVRAAGVNDMEADQSHFESALASRFDLLQGFLHPRAGRHSETLVRVEVDTADDKRLHAQHADGRATSSKRNRDGTGCDN
jgi:hypothetical protein